MMASIIMAGSDVVEPGIRAKSGIIIWRHRHKSKSKIDIWRHRIMATRQPASTLVDTLQMTQLYNSDTVSVPFCIVDIVLMTGYTPAKCNHIYKMLICMSILQVHVQCTSLSFWLQVGQYACTACD